ncbi:MAG: divergent polysaccharide deacetylase family protein [Magnetococcales bacterium]|nr:divergent polysaccharide deacetylase family protein [Magnetococcales bacterium]
MLLDRDRAIFNPLAPDVPVQGVGSLPFPTAVLTGPSPTATSPTVAGENGDMSVAVRGGVAVPPGVFPSAAGVMSQGMRGASRGGDLPGGVAASAATTTVTAALERKENNAEEAKGILYEEHFSDEGEAARETAETAAAARLPPVAGSGARSGWARVAVIIDDLGYNGPVSEAMARLPADVTLAILPGGGHSRQVAHIGHAAGKEIILHQPMEPRGYPRLNPGPGALLMGMDRERMRRVLTANLEKFPEARGINNHMGSRFTGDSGGMGQVMEVLAERGLFFVDSRTAGGSVGVREAVAHHVPRVQRDVFLDNVPQVKAINQQLARLEAVAHRQGSAVAIGHPYPATLIALRAWLSEARSRKIEVIRASQLLGPESARARYQVRSHVVAQAR